MPSPATTTQLDIAANGVATLTLKPGAAGKPPTLDHAVLEEINHRCEELERATSSVRLLVVTSAVDKYFCVGANVAALKECVPEKMPAWVMAGHAVFNRLEDLPFPTIARVTGFALGGGLELAMACDLIYATAEAKLGQTEARLGFVSGWGGAWRLPQRVGRARAKELFFAARIVNALEACRLGLVDRVVDDIPALDSLLAAFAAEVAGNGAGAIARQKSLLRLCAESGRDGSAAAEARASTDQMADPDTRARVAAFLQRGKN